jgi:glycosyltransferase involved in cell wall biosynthesis
MLNVCILSELYFPEVTVPAPILTSISEGLASRAHVKVICSQPTYSARGIRAPHREVRNGVHITRVSSTTLDKDVFIYRIINFVTISLSIFFTSLRQINRGDIVLVVTNPPLLPFFTVAVCKLKRAKSILLIHDMYPEVLILTGMIKPNSLLSRFGYKITSSLYRSCDSLVVIGRDMECLAARKLGQSNNKIRIIPNWADVDFITPRDREQNILLKELKLADRFVVQYSGNMGRTHGLEDLYQAAKQLDVQPDIQFLFIGSGAKKRWLEKIMRDDEIKNSTVLLPRSRHDLPDSLNACDIAVIAFNAGMSGVSVPSRMYNVMAAGKPILAVANADSELAMVITEENAGWVVPPGNPNLIVEKILYGRSNPEECREKGLNGRRAVEKKYSFKQVLTAYEQLIEELAAY